MAQVTFEELKEEHLNAVLEIYNYYIINTSVTFHLHPLNTDELTKVVYLKDQKYKSFIIRYGEVICGYVVLGKHKERPAYDVTAEVAVYLRHDYIQKGIGTLAVKFIEDVARQNKEIHSLIATVCSENKESIRLFEKCGYERCAYYREIGKKFGRYLDLVVYQKIIN